MHNYNRRNRFIFGAIAGLLLLAGCGRSDEKEIALITNGGTVEDQSVNQSAWESIQRFAQINKKTYEHYEPKERSTKGYEEAIDKALKGGAEIIICPGKEFETAVYDMQKEDLSVKYLLLDGVPHAQDSDREKLRGNTHAVLFAREQAGYLAGYAAVYEGYTNLGFMGGREDEASTRYGSGFVQGANAAAIEKGLTQDQVVIRYGFLGSDTLSPAVAQKAMAWYDGGCQVIFGCNSSILNALGKAAEERGKLVISAESSMELFSGRVLTYTKNTYGEVIYNVLEQFGENKYPGGEKTTVDISSDSVGLDMEHSAFQTFSQEQYQAVCEKIKNQEITVQVENVTKDLSKYDIKNITVNMEK